MVSSFSQLAPCLLKPVKTELFNPNWVPGTHHVAIFTLGNHNFRLCSRFYIKCIDLHGIKCFKCCCCCYNPRADYVFFRRSDWLAVVHYILYRAERVHRTTVIQRTPATVTWNMIEDWNSRLSSERFKYSRNRNTKGDFELMGKLWEEGRCKHPSLFLAL